MPFPLSDEVKGLFDRLASDFARRQRDDAAVTTHCALVLIESARDDLLGRTEPYAFTKVELRERTFDRMRANGEQKNLDAHTFTKTPDHVAQLFDKRTFDDAATQTRVRFAGPTFKARGAKGQPDTYFLIPRWDVLPDAAIVRTERPPLALIRRSGALAALILHVRSGVVVADMRALFNEDIYSRKLSDEDEGALLKKIVTVYMPPPIQDKLDETIAWLIHVFVVEIARDDLHRYFHDIERDALKLAGRDHWIAGGWLHTNLGLSEDEAAKTRSMLLTSMRLGWYAIAEHLGATLLHLLSELGTPPVSLAR